MNLMISKLVHGFFRRGGIGFKLFGKRFFYSSEENIENVIERCIVFYDLYNCSGYVVSLIICEKFYRIIIRIAAQGMLIPGIL